MNKLMKYIVGSVVSLGILLSGSTMTSDSVAHGANEPKCPEVWPAYEEGYGINFEGFYGDYFIIISTSSNDSTMGRAYPKDARYEVGYTPGSPSETCYVDLDKMNQVFFSKDKGVRSESKPSESRPSESVYMMGGSTYSPKQYYVWDNAEYGGYFKQHVEGDCTGNACPALPSGILTGIVINRDGTVALDDTGHARYTVTSDRAFFANIEGTPVPGPRE